MKEKILRIMALVVEIEELSRCTTRELYESKTAINVMVNLSTILHRLEIIISSKSDNDYPRTIVIDTRRNESYNIEEMDDVIERLEEIKKLKGLYLIMKISKELQDKVLKITTLAMELNNNTTV